MNLFRFGQNPGPGYWRPVWWRAAEVCYSHGVYSRWRYIYVRWTFKLLGRQTKAECCLYDTLPNSTWQVWNCLTLHYVLNLNYWESVLNLLNLFFRFIIVVEHDLSVLDYLSDFICCLYGVPGAYGVVTMPFSVREGMGYNTFIIIFIICSF